MGNQRPPSPAYTFAVTKPAAGESVYAAKLTIYGSGDIVAVFFGNEVPLLKAKAKQLYPYMQAPAHTDSVPGTTYTAQTDKTADGYATTIRADGKVTSVFHAHSADQAKVKAVTAFPKLSQQIGAVLVT